MKLVIVESPNKCKKIGSYLGPGYRLAATVGHFRDLPQRGLNVDLDTMKPTYLVDPSKRDVVKRLKAEAAKADQVLIATDPDREGEAIGWHAAQVLGLGSQALRIVFSEITKKALQAALATPRPIDQDLVDAQQARRVLDRIVGYKVSPLLQQALRPGLSAGRVQTATLHLVCKRERERLDHEPETYWVVKIKYHNGLISELSDQAGKPIRPRDEREAQEAARAARESPHTVEQVERKEVPKRPPPPFTTSTLQQAASARLGFGPDRTMKTAQQLFESGKITYHRSDSVSVSDEAVSMARDWIRSNQPGSLPDKAPSYRAKAGAQEAHEAIRPTGLDPVDLSGDQKALYDLVRARFLASQMKPARLAKTLVLTRTPDGSFRFAARGTEVLEAHWLSLYEPDDEKKKDDDEAQALPTVQQGEELAVEKVDLDAKQTKPPARYTEAGLVKEMEKLRIGRPSTYAATISVLYRREYVVKDNTRGHGKNRRKAVAPTPLGMQVDDLMLVGLESLTSHEYTARMEEQLDRIAEGKARWDAYLKDWWTNDFRLKLGRAGQIWAEHLAGLQKRTAGDKQSARATGLDPDAPTCPDCKKPMRKRTGKSGEFWGCTGYPDCRKTLPIAAQVPGKKGRQSTSILCPDCGKPMAERKGKQGKFLGCTGYPECRKTLPIELTRKRQKKCPECGSVMTRRTGPRGKFWGCSGYPGCRHTEPIPSRKSSRGTDRH